MCSTCLRKPLGDDGDNEHLIVVETPKGDLLATWSQGAYEMSRDYRTVASRSRDGGVTWTPPETIVGPTDHPGFHRGLRRSAGEP